MAETPEGKIKRKILAWIKATWPDSYSFRYPAGMFGRAGVPDIIACIEGFFVAIEVKSDVGRATGLQILELKSIQKAKGVAVLIYGFDTVKLEKLRVIINGKVQRIHLAGP